MSGRRTTPPRGASADAFGRAEEVTVQEALLDEPGMRHVRVEQGLANQFKIAVDLC